MLNKFVAYKNDGGIIRSLDFSEATLTELPHSFMSKGNETVDGNLSKDKRNEYLEKCCCPMDWLKLATMHFLLALICEFLILLAI